MVIIYTSAGCVSCRKAKQWLKQNDIKFLEKNIFSLLLDKKEIAYLASRCENGFEDIISKRSKVLMESDIDLDALSFNELVAFIQKHPSVLRRPILIDVDSMLVGYDDDEISTFLPAYMRHKQVHEDCKPNCSNFEFCGKMRES